MTDYRTHGDDKNTTHVEEAACQPLTIVNLWAQASAVDQIYKNFVLLNVNNHCVRMAVMQGEYRWHQHPRSDECFLVIEGELEIDIKADRKDANQSPEQPEPQTVRLKPGQAFTIPAGTIHRTRARTRTVNLCFEDRNAYTDVVFEKMEQE